MILTPFIWVAATQPSEETEDLRLVLFLTISWHFCVKLLL